ncbi:MAG: hypothetical protein U0271_37530 [Polyangiaceae bacterium]
MAELEAELDRARAARSEDIRRVWFVGIALFIGGLGVLGGISIRRPLVRLAASHEYHVTFPQPVYVTTASAVAPVLRDDDEKAERTRLHVPLSAADQAAMMKAAKRFFDAAKKADGAALNALAHPIAGLELVAEGLTLTPSELFACKRDPQRYSVNVGGGSEDSTTGTCSSLVGRYGEDDYLDKGQVLYDAVPDAVEGVEGETRSFVYFHIPGADGHELEWKGVALVFDRVGAQLVLVAIRRTYWTP